MGAQVLRLRSTRKFFWIGKRQGYAVAVFVRRCQGKARRGICQLPSNADFTFGGLAGKDALKFLVEIAEKTGARFDTGHIARRIQLVAIHPIDTETLQTALFIEKADTVSVMERFHSGNGKVIAALLFHRTHLLAQGLRRIERGDFPVATLQEVMGEATAETLVQPGREVETASPRRSTYVLLATGENGIQLAAVGSRNVLHIGNVLQPPFYLEGRGAGIQQVFQHFALVQVFQGEQVLVADDCFPVGIYQAERQAAELGTLSPVGASAETCLTDVALTAVAYTKRTVHKDFQRCFRTSLVDSAYLLQ